RAGKGPARRRKAAGSCPRPFPARVAWFRPRIASAAACARAAASPPGWRSLTGAALALGAGEGGVVDPARDLAVVLLAEQREVVDAGGAGRVVTGKRLGPGLGVGVAGGGGRGPGGGGPSPPPPPPSRPGGRGRG